MAKFMIDVVVLTIKEEKTGPQVLVFTDGSGEALDLAEQALNRKKGDLTVTLERVIRPMEFENLKLLPEMKE